jgi:hypothetical protein
MECQYVKQINELYWILRPRCTQVHLYNKFTYIIQAKELQFVFLLYPTDPHKASINHVGILKKECIHPCTRF